MAPLKNVALCALLTATSCAVSIDPMHAAVKRATTSQRKLLGSSFGAAATNVFNPTTNATYDYVVVGGGTAGIPMGVRLAEAGYTVAIVEAGVFYEVQNSNFSQVPLYATAFGSTAGGAPSAGLIDWGFKTTPQVGEDNMVGQYPRGKTLGGSSARNYQVYHFGTNGSYQQWANDVGDQSYTMENFYPYLHKPLNFTPAVQPRPANATPEYASDLNSDKSGPLSVTYGAFAWIWSTFATAAFAQVGMGRRADGFTAGGLNGSAYPLLSINATLFERDSSQTSYLNQLGLPNDNLIIYDGTLATKILFDSSKNAQGVAADFGGVNLTLYARNEVILSAGAFQSPQLLMVSGIGPKSTLAQFDIPLISALAGVGQNMWDHVLGGISRRVNAFTTGRMTDNATLQAETLDEYLATPPRGPLTSLSLDVLAFEKLPEPYRSALPNATQQALAQFPTDWPDVEYLVNSAYNGPMSGFIGSPDGQDWGSILVALVAPLSRGNVTLASADMHDKPVIDPGWLSSPDDQQVALQGWKRLTQIFNQTSLAPVFAGTQQYPPAANVSTDADILAHIRAGFGSVLHAACTCKMGLQNDSMAVLDSQARVFGVQNLRVVDASSFPLLPPGHPQATIYALAEKIAAEIINGRHSTSSSVGPEL